MTPSEGIFGGSCSKVFHFYSYSVLSTLWDTLNVNKLALQLLTNFNDLSIIILTTKICF